MILFTLYNNRSYGITDAYSLIYTLSTFIYPTPLCRFIFTSFVPVIFYIVLRSILLQYFLRCPLLYPVYMGSTPILDPTSSCWNWYIQAPPHGAVPLRDVPELCSNHLLSYFIWSPQRPRLTLSCQIQTWALYFLV